MTDYRIYLPGFDGHAIGAEDGETVLDRGTVAGFVWEDIPRDVVGEWISNLGKRREDVVSLGKNARN